MKNSEFKRELINACKKLLNDKLHALNDELKSLRESAESDTKSSMGDKYETGREMIMQERSKLEEQKLVLAKQLSFVSAVDLNKSFVQAEFGALVATDSAIYFICAALGLIKSNERNAFVVSAGSPIGQAMIGKKQGDSFSMNGLAQTILEIA